jgi:hypothetical protein
MNLDETVRYPTESDDWIKTVLIGGVLIFLGFLIVPLFLVYGYIIRTIRGVLADDPSPPEFDEWGELFVDGVSAWVVSVVYLLVPLIVAGITIGGSIAAVATGSEIGAAAGTGGLLVGLTVSMILSLVFGYLAVVALVNFAREGRFGAAFDFDTIKTVALDRDYAIAWLVSMGVFLVAGIVSMIPLVGWILTPFVSFYAAIVAGNLWAGGFTRALESMDDLARQRNEEASI